MNANFRRDYLYKVTENSRLKGLDKGTLLRYLRFDRKTREYIFIEGICQHSLEFQLRLPETSSHILTHRLKRDEWVGYEQTDRYL